MKTLLILAYDFPPYVSVGGLRPYSWYEYLHEFDIYPIVVTRQWGNKHGNHLDYVEKSDLPYTITETSETGTIIRTPYSPNMANKLLLRYGDNRFKLLRKMITGWFEMAQWFFNVGPKAGLYHGAKRYLKRNKVDAIIATGDPFVLFRYASKLSKQFRIPWVADYRDPWFTTRNYYDLNLIHGLFVRKERKLLESAKGITVVSDYVKQKIAFNPERVKYSIISNGYNEQAIKNTYSIQQNNTILSIGLAGSIFNYHPYKSFLKIFFVVIDLTKTNIALNLYGINNDTEIKKYIFSNFPNHYRFVNIFPKIQYAEVLKKLATNNALLLFNYYSNMGTKIYDYIGLKRKIIFCYEDDLNAKVLKEKYYSSNENQMQNNFLQQHLIEKTNSGIIVKDETHLKTVLLNLVEEFKLNKNIECNSIGIEQYTRTQQTKLLSQFIKTLLY